MAESIKNSRAPVTLAERFDHYCAEVQQIVIRGIEHPRFELKREASISRENLADRLDFVKLIQGIANAHIAEERFIVVGADQQERRFYNVQNASEFDPATLSQIISKYLDPQPRLEVFNNARAENGELYVLIVVSPDQPRPIVVVTEGKSDKRVPFRLGDIWIKKDTSLQLSARADLDQMYESCIKYRVDEEAESRARRRFDHFRETMGTALVAQSAPSVPSPELIVGGKGHLQKVAESVISSGNDLSFKMFLEMARTRLVEGWDSLESGDITKVFDTDAWIAQWSEIYRDQFVPALDSTVDLGMQVIRYDAPSTWLAIVIDKLINGLTERYSVTQFLRTLPFRWASSQVVNSRIGISHLASCTGRSFNENLPTRYLTLS